MYFIITVVTGGGGRVARRVCVVKGGVRGEGGIHGKGG